MIVAVILHHNKPANADKLYEQLEGVFERVELWDSGSDPDKIPLHVTESFDNIYWAGAWRKIIERYSDADAVWMIGCDIELQNAAEEYQTCLQDMQVFGCWSPCIDGRAHPFMRAENYTHGKPCQVRNIEGMALAMSGTLMKNLGEMPDSKFGFGLDYWFCHSAREQTLPNIIDGRVTVGHPPEIGYDEKEAHDEMESVFGRYFGEDFRQTIFQYDETYGGNLTEPPPEPVKTESKMLTIVTVDNGWGVEEFVSITKDINARKILLQKGASSLEHLREQGIQVIPYDTADIKAIIRVADIALFARVGPANEREYRKILEAGIPTVVHVNHAKGLIEHEKNGFLFGNEDWAKTWLNHLIDKPELREKVTVREQEPPKPQPEPPKVTEREVPTSFDEALDEFKEGKTVPLETALNETPPPIVTVITPTYKRDIEMVRRSIEVMQLQYEQNWEHLICSNGLEEPAVRKLIEDMGDERVTYHWCEAPLGDYGNYARKEMLEVARGDYVLMLDDDNYIMPEYIRLMLETLEMSKADFAVCRVMHFGPLNEKVRGKPPVILGTDKLEVYHIDILQFLMRRDAIIDIGWDRENGYISEVSLERMASKYRGVEIPLVLGVHI